MKSIRFLALAAGLALCLIVPFALRGYRGDDFQFHFSSWMGLRQAWLSGEVAPGWDGLANYPYGDPRFCFYPPISLWLGTLLSTILPPVVAPAVFVWLALMLSGVCMLVASQSVIGAKNKYLAALLYMASPYLLITAITRFAAAELLVLAWLPLIVLYFLHTLGRRGKRATLLLGLLLALTWLTNIPASIALAYLLLFAAMIASIRRRNVWALVRFLAAEGIAILASAFYLVPAFVEKKWITTDALLHQDFRDYFIFGPLSRIHRVHFELGIWIISCVEVAAVAGCLLGRGRAAKQHSRMLYLIAIIAFLFQLPLSAVLWHRLPELRFVQFPFRFLATIGVVLPLVALGTGIRPWLMKTACALTVALAMLPVIFYLRIAPASYSATMDYLAALQHGYPGTEEYVPVGTKLPSSPLALMPVGVVGDSRGSQCSVNALPGGPRFRLVAVSAGALCRLRFPVYFYPYWEAMDETGAKLITSRDDAGLLIVEVPKGQHTVRVRFHVYSLIRIVSVAASFAVFLYFLLEFLRFRRRNALRARTEQQPMPRQDSDRSNVPTASAIL